MPQSSDDHRREEEKVCAHGTAGRSNAFGVMPGLDPGIHEVERTENLTLIVAAQPHGLPGQARQ
jgi:hypothetical protein